MPRDSFLSDDCPPMGIYETLPEQALFFEWLREGGRPEELPPEVRGHHVRSAHPHHDDVGLLRR